MLKNVKLVAKRSPVLLLLNGALKIYTKLTQKKKLFFIFFVVSSVIIRILYRKFLGFLFSVALVKNVVIEE